jgi:N6-adenosine-specific RNA methylase IME4
VVKAAPVLTVPGFILSKTGLRPDGKPTLQQWREAGQVFFQAGGSLHWWIGDWLNYGERCYGNTYTKAMEMSGFDYQTCADDKWVASRVEFSRRREHLSFAHHRETAGLEAEAQDSILAAAERQGWNRNELRQQVRLYQERKTIPLPPANGCTVYDLRTLIHKGYRFGTIYADPPWQYDNQATRAATDNHYPTMTLEEIAALPIQELAADNAHLHLWTTNSFIFDCPRIMEAWGFEYKSKFTWCKPYFGLGNYWRVATEDMLLGVRGSQPFRDAGLINWLESDRGEHSEKPEAIRRLIERASPGPYLELFGRRPVAGWTVWGNEIDRAEFRNNKRVLA